MDKEKRTEAVAKQIEMVRMKTWEIEKERSCRVLRKQQQEYGWEQAA